LPGASSMNTIRSGPFVSVVTPFYNTAAYLDECIRSVLAQTHEDFEYLLVDNCSTDSSRDIAAAHAARDSRIRLLTNPSHLSQVDNYNQALKQISDQSLYVKIVQADDWIFPDCLRLMTQVASLSPRIGMVSSYSLRGTQLGGGGIPVEQKVISGIEVCRQQLLQGRFFFGSPTTVMYRADIVRGRSPFYSINRHHEDTEAAYEIMLEHDLGFAHQVLSFRRVDELSITGQRQSYFPWILDRLVVLRRYGPSVLSEVEYSTLWRDHWHRYHEFIFRSLLGRRGRDFWAYHAKGLSPLGLSISWPLVGWTGALAALDALGNPKATVEQFIGRIRSRRREAGSRNPASALESEFGSSD